MATNAEIEERWIEAWNDLFDIVEERWRVSCLLPDGSIVDTETCKGWLQESAYQGYCLKVEEGWVNGERGIVALRFKESKSL
ncbi:hypothetical protein IQ250_30515 [Pseudanabaenaceae cyanobacterium LEGE 13415]|nr:hypothetical protein [Pseudanabaenaceae cyanobacterium LEGE 13415]